MSTTNVVNDQPPKSVNIKLTAKEKSRASQIVQLLPSYSTIAPLQQLLKQGGASYTGTWASIYVGRVLPALEKGQISVSDLENLLSDGEEHGMQHLFLYSCNKKLAKSLIGSTQAIEKGLKSINLDHLLGQTTKSPDKRTFNATDVRIEGEANDLSLIIKFVEIQTVERAGKRERDGNQYITPIVKEDLRIVSLVKLSSDGSLEVRIASKKGNYRYEIIKEQIAKFLAPYFDIEDFLPTSLTKAKYSLMKQPKGNQQKLIVKKMKVVDGSGEAFANSTTEEEAVPQSLADRLLASATPMENCDSCRIVILKQKDTGLPSKNITVNLSGAANELSILCQCLKDEHSYVLSTIQQANR